MHLSFNALKTVFMAFFTQKVVSPLLIIMGGCLVPRSSQCTYLGLVMGDKLSWYAHLESKFISGKTLSIFHY